MSTPYLSEIKIMSFNFPPKGWAFCNGQQLPINQNQALFALLGTRYGGNGQTVFALPDLRGRIPIHFSNGHNLGEAAGSTSVTITQQTMPTHTHAMMGGTAAVAATTANSIPGAPGTNKNLAASIASVQGGGTSPVQIYGSPVNLTAMSPSAVTSVGGSQPHNNMMPYLVLNFCIALQGIFPSQN
jgi:microcystin-dependent protein